MEEEIYLTFYGVYLFGDYRDIHARRNVGFMKDKIASTQMSDGFITWDFLLFVSVHVLIENIRYHAVIETQL